MAYYISKDCKNDFYSNPKMKLASNLTLVGLIAGAPSKDPATDPEKNDPVAALADHAFERQNQMRIQIQHWQLGVANSDEIAQKFIKETQACFKIMSPGPDRPVFPPSSGIILKTRKE